MTDPTQLNDEPGVREGDPAIEPSDRPAPAPKRRGAWPPWGLGLFVWLLVTGVAAELYLYRFFEDRTHLQRAVDEWRAHPDRHNDPIWVFGTCHANDLHEDAIVEAWGGGAVINIGAPASTSIDWVVAAERMLVEGGRPRAILLAPAGSDLQLRPSPWSSQTMELSTWRQMPEIVGSSCQSIGCAADLGLRKLSRVFRYRGYLGHLAWTAVGVPAPAARAAGQDEPGADRFSPDRFRGAPLRPPDGIVEQRESWLTPTLRLREDIWAVEGETPLLSPTLDPYHWTRQMVALGRRIGAPVLLYQIPPRPSGERDREHRELRTELGHLTAQLGVPFLSHPDLSALQPDQYMDDQHMKSPAQRIVSRDLGLALGALDPAVLGPWRSTTGVAQPTPMPAGPPP